MKYPFIPKEYRPKVSKEMIEKSVDIDYIFLSNYPGENKKLIVIISSNNDMVSISLYKHVIKEKTCLGAPIVHLFCEDLGRIWNFSFFKQQLYLYVEGVRIEPLSLYVRHYSIKKETDNRDEHINFLQVVDLWKAGKVFGQKSDHFFNNSKLYSELNLIFLLNNV